MCTVSSAPPSDMPKPHVCYSLNWETREEIARHKWILSEIAGFDVGELVAARGWVRAHWNGFLRAKWLEHLLGINYWIELNHDDFGLLRRLFLDSPYIDEITHQLKMRGENLTIINDAVERNWPMEHVIHILTALDMNSRRLAWSVEEGLIPFD